MILRYLDRPSATFVAEQNQEGHGDLEARFENSHLANSTQAALEPSGSSVESCRQCSARFTGTNARTNLQRHLRASLRHNRDAGLKCPLPECSMRPLMRRDNLGPHLQRKH